MSLKRLYALDLMRFFAAFAVMLYHYSPALEKTSLAPLTHVTQFGYLGVPLFFIISGFVIARSAENRSPFEFAVARFARLYPAYWTGLFITVAIVVSLDAGSISVQQVLVGLTMLNDYFGIESIDGVYWTLHVELKFYGCIFLLSLFGVFKRHKVWLSLWAMITVTYLAFGEPSFMGWFISPSYSCYFIAGVAFYFWYRDGPDVGIGTLLVISLALSSIFAYRQAPGFVAEATATDGWTAVLIVWSFFSLFGLLVAGRLNFHGGRVVLALGGMTYPLYLIHARAGKALIHDFSQSLSILMSVVLVSIIMLVLALVVHLYIERRAGTQLKQFLLIRLPSTLRTSVDRKS